MFDLPWYVFALLGALFVSLASVIQKRELAHDDPLHFSAGMALTGGVFSLLLLPFVDWNSLNTSALLFIYAISVLGSLGFALTAHAMKRLGAGELSAILAFSPAATAVFGVVFLGETLSPQAMLGTLVMVAGLVFLEGRRFSLTLDVRRYLNQKSLPVAIALLAVTVYSLGTILDRQFLTTHAVSALDFIILFQAATALNFCAFSLVRPKKDHLLSSSVRRHPLEVVAVALLMFLSRVFYAQSISMAYAAFAAALKRTGALFTILFAGTFLKEKNILHTLAAVLVIVAGAVLIVFA